jgi:uncharacterized membrane protein YidH (DUF202 family)
MAELSTATLEPGLANERTVLAWNRSGLAFAVCLAVLVRHLWPLDGADQEWALGLIAGAAVVWSAALLLLTISRRSRNRYRPQSRAVFTLMTAGTIILAAAGFVLAFVAP